MYSPLSYILILCLSIQIFSSDITQSDKSSLWDKYPTYDGYLEIMKKFQKDFPNGFSFNKMCNNLYSLCNKGAE